MFTHRARAPAQHDGIERLVEAERSWQVALDAARAEAARIVAVAEATAATAEREAEASLPQLLAARRAETDRSMEHDVRIAQDELRRRAARYANAGDAVVTRLAAGVAARAPWLCTPPQRGDA